LLRQLFLDFKKRVDQRLRVLHKAWTQSRHTSKKLSKRIIAGELRTRGVDQQSIDEALDEIDDESEYRTAFSLAMRKYSTMSRLEPEVQIRRVQSLLQRKGFSFSTISRVIRELRYSVRRAAVATTAAA